MTPAPTCIVLPDDRSASDVARRIVGDESRWRELTGCNPQKRKNALGGFHFLADGERLYLPFDWPRDPFANQAVMPGAASAPKRFEAGALGDVVLPNGWTDSDLKCVMVMAKDLGVADPKSLVYVWASETGNSAQQQLNPRTKLDLVSNDRWSPFFAGGLNGSTAPVCRGMGFRSADDWLTAPIAVQLQGIFRQYKIHVQRLGEGFESRAQKLGTTAAALIYAFNFLPAYATGLRSATQAIVTAGSPFYDQNRVLDTDKKGYISLRDFERLTAPRRWPNGWPVYAITYRLDQLQHDWVTIASLGPTGSSVWDGIRDRWTALTGKRVADEAPNVLAGTPQASPFFDAGGKRLTPTQAWQATGVVFFVGFIIAYAQGWIRR